MIITIITWKTLSWEIITLLQIAIIKSKIEEVIPPNSVAVRSIAKKALKYEPPSSRELLIFWVGRGLT